MEAWRKVDVKAFKTLGERGERCATITEKILAAPPAGRRARRATSSTPKWTSSWPTTSPRRWPSTSSRRPASTRSSTRTKVALVPDHFTPNKDIKSAEQAKMMRDFARKHGIAHYYEVGRVGIEHALLPEQGSWCRATSSSAPTVTPARTGRWARSPPAWAPPTSPRPWHWGEVWLRVPETIKFVFSRHARPLGDRQGPHPVHHRPDRRGRRPLPGDGVRRRRPSRPCPWTSASPCATWPSRPAARAASSPRREDHAVPAEPAGRQPRTSTGTSSPTTPTPCTSACSRWTRPLEPPRWRAAPAENAQAPPTGDIAIDQVVIGSCTNGRIEDLHAGGRDPRGQEGRPRTCAASSSRAPRTSIWQAIDDGLMETSSSRPAAS